MCNMVCNISNNRWNFNMQTATSNQLVGGSSPSWRASYKTFGTIEIQCFRGFLFCNLFQFTVNKLLFTPLIPLSDVQLGVQLAHLTKCNYHYTHNGIFFKPSYFLRFYLSSHDTLRRVVIYMLIL